MKLPSDYLKDFLKHLEYVRRRNLIKKLIKYLDYEKRLRGKNG